MAEIEFKRRGTPLWVVVLVLLVIAGVLYALFGRHRTPATADSTSAAAPTTGGSPSVSAAPSGAGGQTSAGAPASNVPATAVGRLSVWADSAKMPSDAATQRGYIAEGIGRLAGALEEAMPQAGAQYVLVKALADSVRLPNRTPNQVINDLQASFFAAAYPLRDYTNGQHVNDAASAIQLTRPIGQQRAEIEKYFKAAAAAFRSPGSKTAPAPATAAPAAPTTP